LIPTAAERLIWGRGAGDGLKVIDTEIGKVGGLICWENYMPAARMALYQQGIEYVSPYFPNKKTLLKQTQNIHRPTRRRFTKLGCLNAAHRERRKMLCHFGQPVLQSI
jgi:nitrilase